MSMPHDAMPPGSQGAGETASSPAARIEAIRRGLLETGGIPTRLLNVTDPRAPPDSRTSPIAPMHARDQKGRVGQAQSPGSGAGSVSSDGSTTGPIYLSPGRHVITVENTSAGMVASPDLVQKASVLVSHAQRASATPASERTTAIERMQDSDYLRICFLSEWCHVTGIISKSATC